MKFRRSAGAPSGPGRRRSETGFGPSAAPGRRPLLRRIRWARLILIGLILGGIGWYLWSSQVSVVAQGVVSGETVSVAPIRAGRLSSISVTCGDVVRSGQTLAALGNQERLLELEERYQGLQGQLREARQSIEPALREASGTVEESYRRLEAARQAVAAERETRETYRRLFEQRAIGRQAWQDAQEGYRDAVAERNVAEARWRGRQAAYDRRESEYFTEIERLQDQLAEVDVQRRRAGRTVLTAPSSGTIATCRHEAGEVLQAGTPVFEVFRTETAHVLAYVEPADVQRIALGATATVRINGLPGRYEGRVTAILPLVQDLPPALSRYFWQQPAWQQHAPVRIEVPSLSGPQRSALSFGARVDVTLRNRGGGWPELEVPTLPEWLPI
jgi:HlyD family secretion protein